MARKKDISYFTDINSDEELESFLSNEENPLIILDVYQEILGPCTVGMHVNIEKIKISLTDSDSLQLGAANATKTDKLKRFRGKSLPTMLFCRNGKCVDIVYGADVPSVTKKVHKHLAIYPPPSIDDDDKADRYYFEFDEMVPDEREEFETRKAITDEEFRIRHEAEMIEKFRELDSMIELMKQKANEMGVTLFMPHVADTAFQKTHENAKWCALVNRALKVIKLTPELMEILNYKLANPIDEQILNYIYNKDVLVVLWSSSSKTAVTKVLKNFIESVTEPQAEEDEEGNRISGVLKPAILNPLRLNADGEIVEAETEKLQDEVEEELVVATTEEEEEKEMENREENIDEVKSKLSLRQTSFHKIRLESKMNDFLTIPPVWSPSNQPGNAVFMYTFFRSYFEAFIPRSPDDEDPYLCVIFPAKKDQEVFEICQGFKKTDLIAFGYFDGNDFDDYELLCKSVQCYTKLPTKKPSDKLIMKIARKTTKLMLALAFAGPLFVSLNLDDAKKECSMIFDREFYAHKDIEIDTKRQDEI